MAPPARWRRVSSRPVHRCRVFDLHEARFDPDDDRAPASFYVVRSPDWVNVVPITPTGEVVLIRQYRFGVEDVTLEIPGGMCDPGESPAAAAARELREETGFEGAIAPLGSVHPNPAIQSNRCWTYVARDVRRTAEPSPDPHESFEVVVTPLARIPEMIRSGAITHSLVIAAFHFLDLAG